MDEKDYRPLCFARIHSFEIGLGKLMLRLLEADWCVFDWSEHSFLGYGLGGECDCRDYLDEGRIGKVMVVIVCFRDKGQRVRVITSIHF